MNEFDNTAEGEAPASMVVPEAGVLAAISRAELDQQITTARAYPRSVTAFRKEALAMATLTPEVAESCLYAVPRAGGTIDGPSVRLAEIVASAWGHSHSGARVVDIGAEFITAQGVFYDLQRNVRVTMEVQRRITDKRGRRYSADVIQSTGNAACSIAMRNAIFRGIPQAFWNDIYMAARKAAIGEGETLAKKRTEALAYLLKQGITNERVFARLGVQGVEDMDFDAVAQLRGIANAIKDGTVDRDEAFPPVEQQGATAPAPATEKGAAGLAGRVKGKVTVVAEPKVQTSAEAKPASKDEKPASKDEIDAEFERAARAQQEAGNG